MCVHKLGATHARGLVKLRLKQDGDVLGVGGLLEGHAGLRLAQIRGLHPGVAVKRCAREHHGRRLRQAVLHEGLLGPGMTKGEKNTNMFLFQRYQVTSVHTKLLTVTLLTVLLLLICRTRNIL